MGGWQQCLTVPPWVYTMSSTQECKALHWPYRDSQMATGLKHPAYALLRVWHTLPFYTVKLCYPVNYKPNWSLSLNTTALHLLLQFFNSCLSYARYVKLTLPSVLRHVGLVTERATGLQKAVGGDNLTEALHVLQLQLSPPPPSSLAPIKSRMETFWYRLTQVHLNQWPLKWRVDMLNPHNISQMRPTLT